MFPEVHLKNMDLQGMIPSFQKQVTRAIRALTQRHLYREETGETKGTTMAWLKMIGLPKLMIKSVVVAVYPIFAPWTPNNGENEAMQCEGFLWLHKNSV